MNFKYLLFLVAVLAATQLHAPVLAAQQAQGDAPSILPSTPVRLAKVKQPQLRYPETARGLEALVITQVDVDAQGTISNVQILSDGFGSEVFHDPVREYLRRLKFEPATVNGVPVASQGLRFPVRFTHGYNPRFESPHAQVAPKKRSSAAFQSELKEVIRLLEARDFAAAHFHAQWMLREKVDLLAEYAVLQAALAQTGVRMGDYQGALTASRAATASVSGTIDRYVPGGPLPRVTERDYLLTRESLAPLFKIRFMLSAKQGSYRDALQAHAEMQALGLVPDSDPTLLDFRRILDVVQGDQILQADIRLGADGRWVHDLLRARFTLSNVVEGSLKTIKLQCAGNEKLLEYASEFEWTIHSDWDSCKLEFAGTPGTQFKLFELPAKDTASAPR